MMTLDDISQVLARLERTDITECEIHDGSQSFRVNFARRGDQPSSCLPVAAQEDRTTTTLASSITVAAPAAGNFRSTHPLTASSITDGTVVQRGDHVGYVEVDSVFCAVTAPIHGRLQSFSRKEGQLTGFGEAVAELNPLRPGSEDDAR
ncbi:biotin/lipoyl-containing protein [Paraburkholderia fungorum]|uniref:biotin/lipoyl-containing protein n=1 Tax=Paraburkholderia fungorum TaxID=134537 RepID=UPI002093AF7A|nr:biotin/lipoyl-containing protein [Paraburkholderia fungorum]USU18884.1 hypothetical protein NFE55_32565 [Paraburkholderia fungorum]USU29120.1 hypothetical protein NFS19_29005 [Paraburkholderia fungorum]